MGRSSVVRAESMDSDPSSSLPRHQASTAADRDGSVNTNLPAEAPSNADSDACTKTEHFDGVLPDLAHAESYTGSEPDSRAGMSRFLPLKRLFGCLKSVPAGVLSNIRPAHRDGETNEASEHARHAQISAPRRASSERVSSGLTWTIPCHPRPRAASTFSRLSSTKTVRPGVRPNRSSAS